MSQSGCLTMTSPPRTICRSQSTKAFCLPWLADFEMCEMISHAGQRRKRPKMSVMMAIFIASSTTGSEQSAAAALNCWFEWAVPSRPIDSTFRFSQRKTPVWRPYDEL